MRRATCLHATASIEMESYRQLGFKNPVVLIPNGVFVPDSIQSIKEPNRGVKQALFISRIHPKKGLLDLVRAWAAVVGSKDQTQPIGAASNTGLSKWELVIVGPDEGGHLAEVMALVNQLGMQDQIQYGGEIWEDQAKWACYQNADLFVLPSYSENFGLVIAEALGCGVPVITTKATPWAELESHRCGWWIETGVAPLVEALRAAMASPLEQLHEMGIRGRQLIQQKYSWAPIGRQMTAVYEWMAGRSRKPDCVVED